MGIAACKIDGMCIEIHPYRTHACMKGRGRTMVCSKSAAALQAVLDQTPC